MTFIDEVVRSIDWSSFRLASRDATGFGDVLTRMVRCETSEEMAEIWRDIENAVFAQDDIFDAAEPTIDVVLAALIDEPPSIVRDQILDLLFLILHGHGVQDDELAARCHDRALLGFWLIAREASLGIGRPREAALEVLELLDPDRADDVRRWLGG